MPIYELSEQYIHGAERVNQAATQLNDAGGEMGALPAILQEVSGTYRATWNSIYYDTLETPGSRPDGATAQYSSTGVYVRRDRFAPRAEAANGLSDTTSELHALLGRYSHLKEQLGSFAIYGMAKRIAETASPLNIGKSVNEARTIVEEAVKKLDEVVTEETQLAQQIAEEATRI